MGDVPTEDSLYGVGAKAVAPVLEPMGLGDWHLAASLVSGLAAKEATVAALNQSYSVEGSAGADTTDIAERVRETHSGQLADRTIPSDKRCRADSRR